MKKLLMVLLFVTISLGAYSQNYELRNIQYIHDGFNMQDSWIEAELYCLEKAQFIFYLHNLDTGQARGYFELAGEKYDFSQLTNSLKMVFLDLPAGSHKLVVRIHEDYQYWGKVEANIYIAHPDVSPTNMLRVEYEH